jgi:hypothetical protein
MVISVEKGFAPQFRIRGGLKIPKDIPLSKAYVEFRHRRHGPMRPPSSGNLGCFRDRQNLPGC